MAAELLASASLGRRSWPSIDAHTLVLVPTGSTEQHGPHLPFSTDSIIAEQVALGVADLLRESNETRQVLVAPTLVFGASGEHQSFAGTVSIGHEALRLILIEMVRSLSTWAGQIIFVNAHGGNVKSLSEACTQLIAEQHAVAWVPCHSPGADPHAGRTETSLLLHIAPELVMMSAAVAGNTAPMSELMGPLSEWGVRAVSESGILGNPLTASVEEGGVLLSRLITDVSNRISEASPDHRGMLRPRAGAGGSR